MSKVAIVAALDREVTPLVRGWHVRSIEHDGRCYKLFEFENVALVVGGIGAEAARRAAEAMISEFRPSHIVSVGFAGALDPALRVGAVLEPRVVINGGDGSRLDTGKGKGTLLSFSVVAGPNQKRKLHRAYGADAVDMEAAAVASTAQLHAVTFGALKVISDTADFVMPPVDKFVASNGSFRASNFALFIAVRPWFWGATITLAQNSKRASKALQAAIMQYVDTVEPRSIAEHP